MQNERAPLHAGSLWLEEAAQVNGIPDPSEFATTGWVNLGLDYQSSSLCWPNPAPAEIRRGWGEEKAGQLLETLLDSGCLYPAWERAAVLCERQKTWNCLDKMLENSTAEKRRWVLFSHHSRENIPVYSNIGVHWSSQDNFWEFWLTLGTGE